MAYTQHRMDFLSKNYKVQFFFFDSLFNVFSLIHSAPISPIMKAFAQSSHRLPPHPGFLGFKKNDWGNLMCSFQDLDASFISGEKKENI